MLIFIILALIFGAVFVISMGCAVGNMDDFRGMKCMLVATVAGMLSVPMALVYVATSYHYQDDTPAVSPSEQLVRDDAMELSREADITVRTAELVANWHYTTKRLCGMDNEDCYTDRAGRYLGTEQNWADMGSYKRIEKECSDLRSDRYSVCLMREWWEQSQGPPDANLSFNARNSLRELACKRDTDSVYRC